MSPTFDVLTVTPNPAIDWTLMVPEFAAGAVNRVAADRTTPGGKGINVAAALAGAGYRVAATGWLGAANAALFESFFATRGIEDHFVRVPGETRIGIKIADPAAGGLTTDVNFPGPTPPPAERSLLMERVLGLATGGGWIVMAGSLPPGVDPGFYCELSTLVTGAGARVLIDTSGEPLRRSLQSEPQILKPNLRELERLVGRCAARAGGHRVGRPRPSERGDGAGGGFPRREGRALRDRGSGRGCQAARGGREKQRRRGRRHGGGNRGGAYSRTRTGRDRAARERFRARRDHRSAG